ncbi:MAG: twin-arginine translocase subunit TatC [Clostridiales bacterium]|nr:twin-arginine translocase subunit TatC [Clostridiales bacterium]
MKKILQQITSQNPKNPQKPKLSRLMTQTQEKQPLIAHIKALRTALIIAVAATAAAFVVLFYVFREPLIDFVLAPVRLRGIEVIATAVSEALMMQFKTCLVAALVVAMPVIIWQIWSFVAPALFPNEKRTFVVIFAATLLLFIAGVVFCYLYVFPLTINLFWEASEGVATAMWSVEAYFSFVLSFVLPFGLMFDLPVVVYMLARRGKVSYRGMAKNRKFFILGIAAIAAILTPPDAVSQMMLMVPMILLYEISAQTTRFVKKKEVVSIAA